MALRAIQPQGHRVIMLPSPPQHVDILPIAQASLVQESIRTEDNIPHVLHPVFRPPGTSTDSLTPELIWEAGQLEPIDRLPISLIKSVFWRPPFRPGNWTPPVFHYGWRPDIQKLLKFARERKLTVTYAQDARDENIRRTTFPNILRPQPHYSQSHYLHMIQTDRAGRKWSLPKPATARLWPPVEDTVHVHGSRVFVFPTIEKALAVMLREAVKDGILAQWCSSVDIALTLRADEGTNFVVSVLTNDCLTASNGDDTGPTPEEMRQLAAVLGVSGSPRWYVDRDDFTWFDVHDRVVL